LRHQPHARREATIEGILVSAATSIGLGVEPTLVLRKSIRQVLILGIEGTLTPRSFSVLLKLAERALTNGGQVANSELMVGLTKHSSEKTISQSVNKLKSELCKAGLERDQAKRLIVNLRTTGYRLDLPAEQIRIDE
jgi:DNA-binding response OmpR family regulator